MKLEKKLDEVKSPGKKKNYIVNNTTIEALLKELSINPGSTLLHTDELAEWIGMMEHSYQAHARATYLSLFSGIKDWNHKRVTGTDIEIEFGHVNIVGTTQPDVIFPKISDSKSDGLIQRFQGMIYSSASCNIEPVYGSADKKLLDEMDKFFIFLSTLENGNVEFDANGKIVCHEMEEHKRIEMLQAEKDSRNSLASHLGKIDTTFATLCLFFEAYDCFNSSKNLRKITKESAIKAMEICKYLMDGFKYIYTISNGNKSDLLKKIASSINDNVFGEIIIPSELHNYNYRRAKREYFNSVIDELEKCKFLYRINENRYYRPNKKKATE
jgi:hypothetical protein